MIFQATGNHFRQLPVYYSFTIYENISLSILSSVSFKPMYCSGVYHFVQSTRWSNIHVHMDIMECKVSPHSMYIESLYRVYCQPILSSNEKKHNQFAIDNNYLWKYPYIIKVIWIFWMGLFWYLKYVLLTIYKHGAISMSIWILWNVKCLHTTCRFILHIHIHVHILMDIMECRILPHSM